MKRNIIKDFTIYKQLLESVAIKRKEISKDKLEEILSESTLVTVPYFGSEESLLEHIEQSFSDTDVLFILNPPKGLTMIENDNNVAVLYTKSNIYIIEDVSEALYDELYKKYS